ncbi:MAG: ribose-phosphate pyrophosphokinase [Thermoanaerobaculia bacterium]|nr:ribose-phosphate pyrophosphokinase [Thermoanaerobaculia bacterium]
MAREAPLIFAPGSGRALGERVASEMGLELSELEERDFDDGEHKIRPLVTVRRREVFVLHSLAGDEGESVNDKLCRLLFFLGGLRDAGAHRVTAVVPYLCYSRKDRKTKTRDPITTRYVAQLLEGVGTDSVVTVDVHNLAAFQNAFRRPTEHVTARPLFVEALLDEIRDEEYDGLVVVSPDAGGVKRVEQLRQALAEALEREIPSAFLEKFRSEGVVSGKAVVGPVEGRTAVMFDDLISSGGTLRRAAEALRDRGARRVVAAATHGVFSPGAEENLGSESLERVLITDTVSPGWISEDLLERKFRVLEIAPVLARALRGIHAGDSIQEILGRS